MKLPSGITACPVHEGAAYLGYKANVDEISNKQIMEKIFIIYNIKYNNEKYLRLSIFKKKIYKYFVIHLRLNSPS